MKRKIGLALGSGGARGWCHIGVIRALAEAGIKPDIVCGASMGALVGAAYASEVLTPLEEFARSVTPVTMARLADVSPASGGLIEGKVIKRQLRELGYRRDFSGLKHPFLAVASDILEAREVWLRDGDLVDAVRASIAVPGIFSPVFHQERWLMDGGMTNPVPVSACRALGAEIVVAVDPNSKLFANPDRTRRIMPEITGIDIESVIRASPEKLQPYLQSILVREKTPAHFPPGYFSVLSLSIDVMLDQIRRSRLAGDPPHVIVNPKMSHRTILEFQRADEAIEEGHRAMMENMNQLTSLL